MKIVDVGTGPVLVLVPGIQGRWEWMKPAVDALARHCRVVTFSLADEPTCGGSFDPARGLDCYVDQVRDAMDEACIDSATVCGVSYGGLVASLFAARHPSRVSGLVLVSAIPPSWKPDRRARFYLRAPRLLSPLFCAASLRMYREIAAATPGVLPGIAAAIRHGFTAVTHVFSPARMARRVRLLEQADIEREVSAVRAPVMIVTGDEGLDRVVPVARTREYLRLWPHAQATTLARTGHLGMITRPDEFARVIAAFMQRAGGAAAARRRIG